MREERRLSDRIQVAVAEVRRVDRAADEAAGSRALTVVTPSS
jgi:hypothetical protein